MDQINQNHLEDELLQRHFDGDLREGRAAEVDRHLQGCAECTARHRALGALHRMVEMAAEDSARGVDFDALFGRIERGIREQRTPGLAERFTVWWRDLAEQRPGQLWVPAAGALAAAVVVAVVLRDDPAPAAPRAHTPTQAEQTGAEQPLEPARAPAVQRADEISSEIVQVDFGSSPGTVFEIALADGKSTPVVWINDDL
jgi:anti-sigma factor RsiW